MKTLILDGQLFQTDAWHRGMGKYMMQVMKKISESNPTYELVVLLNSNIATDDVRFETLKYLCPNFKQLHVELPVVRKGEKPEAAIYTRQLDAYLEGAYDEDHQISFMLITLFLFDIYSEFPARADEKTMVFYDLIPLLNWKELGGYFPPEIYMARFRQLYQADKIFCISKTTQDDLVSTFGIHHSKTTNINGGFTDHHQDSEKPKHFIVPKKYILFPTGDLPHKNNKLIFSAFKDVVESDKDAHLLVTSSFHNTARKALLRICSKNVVFTGNVSEEELQYLYQNSTIILFGSKYEGLGLPVLDAVFHGKPVVASNISVFTEMSMDAFYYFGMNDKDAARRAILDALKFKGFKEKKMHYLDILSRYDWDKVAKLMLMNLNFASNEASLFDLALSSKRIAVVSANPGINPDRYGLSEKMYFLLRSSGVDLSYFFDSEGKAHDVMQRPTFLDHVGAKVFDIKRLTVDAYKDYDAIFYIIDERALRFKVGRVMSVLPGFVLFDSGIDKDGIIYKATTRFKRGGKELVIDNSNKSAYEQAAKYILKTTKEGYAASSLEILLKSKRPLVAKKMYIKRKLG